MALEELIQHPVNRRGLFKGAAGIGSGLAAARFPFAKRASAAGFVSVLCPLPPDPAPPGVSSFSTGALSTWQTTNNAFVGYEAIAWPQIHDKIKAGFRSGIRGHDVYYMSGWAPEFSRFLLPLDSMISPNLKGDLPKSSLSAVTWDGHVFGIPYTLNLLTLLFNTEHLRIAGITAPPATWDELKGHASALTRDGRYGWSINYGTPDGIGGTASYWMAFLQQAGGTMYGPDGLPVFNDAPGVDALQLMIDLMPYTDPNALSHTSIIDVTNVFKHGGASMMMNWPFMWRDVQDGSTSLVATAVRSSVLPAGPAGSASIDGADSWTIAASTPEPELAWELIEFFLDREVQTQQVLNTGWLPIRLSTLRDPDVQAVATNAAVVLEQARHPYDSFVTPDYDAVTRALGSEIQRALRGEQTAAEALQAASDSVTEIVKVRPSS